MKKLIVLIASIIISFSIISSSNAGSLESKIYKKAIVSRYQIAKDYSYGNKYNKRIEEIFTKLRGQKDKVTLRKLKSLLQEKIIGYNNKSTLSRKDRKKLNLYNNLYYRTILLLDYNLK